MPLSHEQVERLANLARLGLHRDAIDTLRTQLDSIFALITQMQAVDTTGVAPMSHPQELSARLREDVVSETDRRAAFQAIAPQSEAGLYLVPRVIE